MRSAIPVVTVSTVAKDHPAEAPLRPHLPAAISRRQWLASGVLAVCTALVALALTAGPNPHQLRPQFLLVGVACSPIALLRRWPLTLLAAATVVKALVMARGVASLPFAIVLGLASYFAASRLPRRVSITAAAASAAVLGGALLYATFAVRRYLPPPRPSKPSCRWPRPGLSVTASRPGGATWPDWPSRRSGSEPPRPNSPASRSGRSGYASLASCTTSWPTPSR